MEIKIKNSKVIVHACVKSLESVQLWHLSPVFHDALATHPLQRNERLHVTHSTSKDRPLQCF